MNEDPAARAEAFNASLRESFAGRLGVRIISAEPALLVAELSTEPRHLNSGGVVHGAVIMAIADTTGALATALNLPAGAGTSTVDSKSNFLATAAAGSVLRAECRPVSRGRRVMLWQTHIRDETGRLVAVVTQTQLVIEAPAASPEQIVRLLEGKPIEEQRRLLAGLERAAARTYRKLAAAADNAEMRTALVAAASRAESNAALLEDGKAAP